MSEMDKFVLQYQVEMKDAISRLEQLNQKVTGVQKQTSATGKEFKEFASGAADELGRIVPGVDRVTSAVRTMGAQFAIAATAVAVLGVGIKSVLDMRAQFGEQRLAGMATGVSGLRMEEYQRKFVRASGGSVDRAMAQEQIKTLSEKLQSAYADPTRMGTEARQFRLLGVEVGQRGQNKVPFNEAFTQLADKFSKMKPEQVQGIAKAIGMNEDFALSLQKLGPSVGKVTELTEAEIKKRVDAEASLAKFNAELAKFNEQAKELEISLGQKLIPAFTKLLTLINNIVDAIPNAWADTKKAAEAQGVDLGQLGKDIRGNPIIQQAASMNPLSWAAKLGDKFGEMLGLRDKESEQVQNVTKAAVQTAEAKPKENGKDDTKPLRTSIDSMVDKLDETNNIATNNAANMSQAIQMFAGAVASFSNAIDEKQAWAAWAGMVGREAGLGSSPAGSTAPGALPGTFPSVAKTAYDEEFKKNAARYGLSEDLLKNVARVESGFNPNAKSGAGALGLMQVMPANMKGTGTTNLLDPSQNIKAGAQILAENLKRANGDVREALMMYHGGLDRSKWGPLTRAYPGKVLGNEAPGPGQNRADLRTVRGESIDKIQLRQVQENIAARLGVPTAQIQHGGINRGDVSFAGSQMKAGVENNIFNIQKELMTVGLPQQTRSRLLTELREQQSGLSILNKHLPTVEGAAQQGERSITIGERAIVININGVQDPDTTGRILRDHLQSELGDIVNQAADGIKY